MANKTEKPTHKRLRDAAKKGQILKSRDLTVSCILLAGVTYLTFFFDISPIVILLEDVFESQFELNMSSYFSMLFFSAFKIIVPVLIVIVILIAAASWMQSKLSIATEALKINFNALNPVNGFKKIFSLRTVKDFVKAILYIIFIGISMMLFWQDNKTVFFQSVNGSISSLFIIWKGLLFRLVIYCLGSLVLVLILDFVAEYFLFMKDMKMDKEEVKREYKDQEGDPEIKYRRKEMHREILSEQLKSDVSNSRLIIANPTHIAIGIYFKPQVSPIPVIAVRETNQMALAVRKYAEEIGVPVVRDVKLARKIFATHRRYDFVCLEQLDAVLHLLLWLEDVESARYLDQGGGEETAENVEKADDGSDELAMLSGREGQGEDDSVPSEE